MSGDGQPDGVATSRSAASDSKVSGVRSWDIKLDGVGDLVPGSPEYAVEGEGGVEALPSLEGRGGLDLESYGFGRFFAVLGDLKSLLLYLPDVRLSFPDILCADAASWDQLISVLISPFLACRAAAVL